MSTHTAINKHLHETANRARDNHRQLIEHILKEHIADISKAELIRSRDRTTVYIDNIPILSIQDATFHTTNEPGKMICTIQQNIYTYTE